MRRLTPRLTLALRLGKTSSRQLSYTVVAGGHHGSCGSQLDASHYWSETAS